jgi:hypothetical protein
MLIVQNNAVTPRKLVVRLGAPQTFRKSDVPKLVFHLFSPYTIKRVAGQLKIVIKVF